MIGSAIACPRVCSLFLLLASCAASDGPIIGVLTVPNDRECETALEDGPEGGSSCFASLYVKYIEAAGGRVAPILYDASDDDIAQIFNSVNGLFFTGGVVNIRHAQESAATSQYLHAASLLFNMTVATNDAGVHMPLWGTCMGFQTLSILAAGDASVLETYAFEAEDLSLPLELTSAARESRLLGKDSVPPKVLRWLTMENLTSNLHHDGVAPESFAANQHLAAFFSVLSTNRDRRGRPFASTIEGRRHPVFAVQWHPERSIFEWDSDEGGINHSAHAVEAMQFFANFLISEARKNQHRFRSAAEERAALIYNYLPQGRTSYQAYVFPSSQQVLSLPARARSPATVVAVRPMRSLPYLPGCPRAFPRRLQHTSSGGKHSAGDIHLCGFQQRSGRPVAPVPRQQRQCVSCGGDSLSLHSIQCVRLLLLRPR